MFPSILIFFGIVFLGVSFKNIKTINNNFLSRKTTTAVNGIFVIIVIFRHFNQYVTFTNSIDLTYLAAINYIGQLMVTTFFFYSGYGIYERIKSDKEEYIKHFFRKRFLKVFLSFSLVIILFAILNFVIYNKFILKDILLAFTGWTSIGNSNWFMFATFFMYLFVLISFKIFKKDNICSLLSITAFSILFIIIVKNYKQPQSYWYDTILCFSLGMWFSYFKDKFIIFLSNNKRYFLLAVCLILLFTTCFNYRKNFIVFEIMSLIFVLLIVLFTFKIQVGNKVLVWLGKNTFNIYILQRIPFLIYKQIGLAHYNIYLYFFVSVISTLILAVVFEFFKNKLFKFIRV